MRSCCRTLLRTTPPCPPSSCRRLTRKGYVAHKKYATVADLLGLGGHTTEEKVKNLIAATEQLLDQLGFPTIDRGTGNFKRRI